MSNTKQLDLIIWGATGFTGQLVSEYINKKYSNTALKWGIAGRNEEKCDGRKTGKQNPPAGGHL